MATLLHWPLLSQHSLNKRVVSLDNGTHSTFPATHNSSMSKARKSSSTWRTHSLDGIDRKLKMTRWENDRHTYDLELLELQYAEMRKETDMMMLKIQELRKSIGLSAEQDTAMTFDGDISSLSVDVLSMDMTVEKLETCMEETLEHLRLETLGLPPKVPSSIMKKRTEPFDTPRQSSEGPRVRFALAGSSSEVQNSRLRKFMQGTHPVETSTATSELSWCPTTPMSSPLDGKR